MNRLRAAWGCLRGKSVIYRVTFQDGAGVINFAPGDIPDVTLEVVVNRRIKLAEPEAS